MDTPVIPRDTEFNDSVYEPAEDSFLLLDALEEDLQKFLSTQKEDSVRRNSNSEDVLFVLEVGCGSGIISTAVANFSILSGRLPVVFAIDINPKACRMTQETAQLNKVEEGKVQTILLDGTKPSSWNSFRQPFDLIICNPPYVPVLPGENSEDSSAGELEKSWAGGPDGNQFIYPFLTNIGKVLGENGVLYLLLSSWNQPEMLVNQVARPNGLFGSLVIRRAAGRERLSVWRFVKQKKKEDIVTVSS